jgi:2-dehydro-3-deoxyphosphogluconate aldolase/(4S)-4-hydroxy-2-oxoglutarate aldolase
MQSRLNPAFLAPARAVRVIPVLTVDDAGRAVELARALAAGGLGLIEITLRTPGALAALGAIARALPNVGVGAGTVRDPEQAKAAIDAGARFIVSPGMTPRLVEAAETWSVPFLPGAVTASEVMALADLGYRFLKFFPAESSGGVGAVKALGAPLADITFCPTGGIDATKARTYLALPNVACVGGSWVAPADAVAAGDWPAITALARAARAGA